jgi:predicted transcriptional regulator
MSPTAWGGRGLGELGNAIVGVLSGSGGAMTPGEVRARLGGSRAYTTVMTVMARLAHRGVLVRHRRPRGYAYTVQPDPADVTAVSMHRLLDADDDRHAVLVRFVDRLSPEDERLLFQLLADAGEPVTGAALGGTGPGDPR